MHKLLIVDDEIWVRERLKDTIDWNEIGVEVVGEAEDGEEALALTGKLCPDIVITDIRMPCIDGLEYIKRLRDAENSTKVILISGYSDFEYAQKAIKLGAFDYILKPIEDDDLISVVKRCTQEIALAESRDDLFRWAKEQEQENLSILREKFFVNLINGYFNSEEDIYQEFTDLGLGEKYCSNTCFIVELDEPSSSKLPRGSDKNAVQAMISGIIQDSLNTLKEGMAFSLNTGGIINLIFSRDEEAILHQHILAISSDIKTRIREAGGLSVTIGIGRVYNSLSSLSKSYEEAKEALQYKAYLGNDNIYDIRDTNTRYKLSYHKFRDMEILLNNIKLGNKDDALTALSKMATEAKKHGDIYPIDFKFLYIDIVNSVFRNILNVKASAQEFSDFSFNFFKQMYFLQTVEETYKWLAETIVRIIEILEGYKNIKKRKIIEKALEFIGSHYTEQITLNDVAEKFYMNASYFCKIFREEMGEPFTQYFINLRIQKAKEYMADPTLKIYEIASKVGYTDVQYFTKIFKSVQGVTPMQYREKIK